MCVFSADKAPDHCAHVFYSLHLALSACMHTLYFPFVCFIARGYLTFTSPTALHLMGTYIVCHWF